MRLRFGFSVAAVALGALLSLAPTIAATPGAIPLIPIHGTIDEGMAHLVERAVADADAQHAPAIVLDVDTFGGLVSAATEIRDALLDAHTPVYAYVSGRAWSAGALVTLAANHIAMSPGSSIGAAEPIPKTVKTVSALRGEFAATASVRHRNVALASAMVDADVNVPGYKAPGAILTLTAAQAQAAGIADAVVPGRALALERWHLDTARVVAAHYSLGERLVRIATDPNISGLLLSIGFIGLLIEMQTLHLIAGVIGISALALFFGTHVYAGFSDNLVIVLAVIGMLGILLELHVLPGHGLPGIIGILALLTAVVLAFGVSYGFVAAQALAIAIVLSAIGFWFAAKLFPQNAFIRKIAFTGVQGRDYVAAPDQTELIGHAGIATSFLRPAGVAAIDGKRVDVLTEGDFVAAGSPVVVTRVEGARIFVRPGV